MPLQQQRQYPGYGIVYPDGVTGIKVIRTFVQAPKKVFHADGSYSFEPPPPAIHELYGGGFAYADGKPVINREHLENITDPKMKERGLQWFETHGKAISPSDIVIKKEGEKPRPEPAFILSTQLPQEKDEVTNDLNKQVVNDPLDVISKSILSLTEMVKKQGEEIAELKKPKVDKRSGKMKERWANPAFRERMKNKKGGKHEVSGHEIAQKDEEGINNRTTPN